MDLKLIQDGLGNYFGLRYDLLALLTVHLPSFCIIILRMLSEEEGQSPSNAFRLIIYALIAPRLSGTAKGLHKSIACILSKFSPLSKCYLLDAIKIPKDYRYFEEDKVEHVTGELDRIQKQVNYEASNFKETYVQEIESIELSNIWARFFGDDNFQLKGVTMSIKGGEKIAILGSLNSGPSALVWVLVKILEPEFGDYRYNGDLVSGIDTKVLRRQYNLISGSARFDKSAVQTAASYTDNSDLNFSR